MSDIIEILSQVKSSASERGMSYYKQTCARKARLNRDAKEAGQEQGHNFKADVGVLFHKLCELYYNEELCSIALPITDYKDDKDPIQEAIRVFKIYKKLFPVSEFQHIAAERGFPEGEAEQRAINDCFGIELFTGRIDRVVRVTAENVEAINRRRGLLLVPGIYLVDYKTHEKKDSQLGLKHDLSLQFAAYMMAWDAISEEKCQGMLVEDVYRHKDLEVMEEDGLPRSFRTTVVPYPSTAVQKAVREYLKWKEAYLKTDQCNMDACAEYGGCYFYKTGVCERS